MSEALMHSCINRPDLSCATCDEECVEDSVAERRAREKEEDVAKSCPGCREPLDKNGSCPLCEQERLGKIRCGNWFGVTCAIMLFCLPAFGQAIYSGPGSYPGAGQWSMIGGGNGIGAALPINWVDSADICSTVLTTTPSMLMVARERVTMPKLQPGCWGL